MQSKGIDSMKANGSNSNAVVKPMDSNNFHGDSESQDMSFSQIDPHTMSELPLDVQNQLKKEFEWKARSKRPVKTGVKAGSKSAFDAIMVGRTSPIKSKGKGRGKGKKKVTVDKKASIRATVKVSSSVDIRNFDSDSNSGLPDDIDMDVFNALPQDIRNEFVKRSPVKSEKSAVQTKNSVEAIDQSIPEEVDIDVFNALPSEIQNELRRNSPKKVNMGASTSALVGTSRVSNPLREHDQFDHQDVKTSPKVEGNLDASSSKIEEGTINQISNTRDEVSEGGPSFCGAKTIGEIRPLLKEWLKSTATPLMEDIEMIAEFLKELVKAWNLQLVEVVLRCLSRNIKLLSEDSSPWKGALTNLVEKVQVVMIQFYGSPLDVDYL